MSKTSNALTGGCLCGAVRYKTSDAPLDVINCHCHSCRKHTGAPMATLAVLEADRVQFSGEERKRYGSAPGVERAFCGQCGTPLTWEVEHDHFGKICALHISTFDQPDKLTPTAHSFYPERISWFDAADNLPRYKSFVAEGILQCHGPQTGDAPD